MEKQRQNSGKMIGKRPGKEFQNEELPLGHEKTAENGGFFYVKRAGRGVPGLDKVTTPTNHGEPCPLSLNSAFDNII